MNKPAKKFIAYYDWNEVKEYLISNNLLSKDDWKDFAIHLHDTGRIKDGKVFGITNFNFKNYGHNGSRSGYIVDVILEHFGEKLPYSEYKHADFIYNF